MDRNPPAELQMRFTTTSDGVRIAYAEIGDGPVRSIFAWHPAHSNNQLNWSMPGLRADTLRISAGQHMLWFDWRNTGLSGSTEEGFTLESGLRDLEAVVNAAGGPVALFGGSASSVVAVPFAAIHPEKVSGLVLWCPMLAPSSGAPRASADLWREVLEAEPEVAAKLFARSAKGWNNSLLSEWERYHASCTPLEYQDTVRRRIAAYDVREYLPRVTCPVLVIQSRDIPHPTVAESVAVAAQLPCGEFPSVAGSSYGLSGAEEDPIPTIVDFLTRRGGGKSAEPEAGLGSNQSLSQREQDVLALIALGLSNREIAERLVLSPATVATHVRHVLEKTGTPNRAAAAAWAARHSSA